MLGWVCRLRLIWPDANALIFFLFAHALHTTADLVWAQMAAASLAPMAVCEKPLAPVIMLERLDSCMLPIGNEARQCHKINQDPSLFKSPSFFIKKDNIAVVIS